jgi:hypothetical protein
LASVTSDVAEHPSLLVERLLQLRSVALRGAAEHDERFRELQERAFESVLRG